MKRRPSQAEPTALQCSTCGKTYDVVSTLKRHERYCRSKGPQSRSRKKSCTACIKAKTRCEMRLVSCKRCEEKGTLCQPECVSADQGGLNANFAQTSLIAEQDTAADAWLHIPTPGDSSSMFSGLQDPTMSEPQYPFSFPSLVDAWTFPTDAAQGIAFDNLGFPPLNINNPPLRLFEAIPAKRVESMASYFMARGMLRSYPDMMRRRETFPPFIHPRCYGSEEDDWELPAWLQTAIKIAQMFYSRKNESKQAIWLAIEAEREKIQQEYHTMDALEVLACAQALSAYWLMRMIDGPLEDETLDRRLINTAHVVYVRLGALARTNLITGEIAGQRPLWRDWIVAESKRRLTALSHVLFRLVHVELKMPCAELDQYAFTILPASKQLWRALDEQSWEREWTNEVGDSPFHSVLRNGDLVNLKNGVEEQHQRKADWDRWYAGADEFGILAILSVDL